MVHVYCGDGKGKTTAAAGMALRSAGNGIGVLFVQFMKSGSSGETAAFGRIREIELLSLSGDQKFTFRMSDEEFEKSKKENRELLRKAAQRFKEPGFGIMILDESLTALEKDMIDEKELLELVRACAGDDSRELVLTGRVPTQEIIGAADYVTDMEKIKHPYDRGTPARRGVEY